MKLVIGEKPGDARIYLDDGRDITSDLHLTSVSLSLQPQEYAKIELTCEFWEGIDIEFDYSQVALSVQHLDMKSNPDDRQEFDDE